MATASYPPLDPKRFRLWVDDSGSDVGALALRAYKYSGIDLSYIYRYILTPMNEVLVKFIPRWVAPNLITLLGLLVCVLCHVVVYLHSSDFGGAGGPVPSWVSVYVGFTLLLYQTLDNLDGKQARRTGNGSALGLLFDHGVDALNTTIVSLTFATVAQAGLTWKVAMLWSFTFTPFVFATWDEYYTHKLTLSEINGPTDGVMLSAAFCLCAAYKPGFWAQTVGSTLPGVFTGSVIETYQMNSLIMAIGIPGVILTVASNIYRVLTSDSGRAAGVVRAFSKLFPFTVLAACAFVWGVYSPSGIFLSHTRLFLFAVGILFASLICKLMLAHLTTAEYRILRSSLIPLVLATANAVAPRLFGIAAANGGATLFGWDELLSLRVVLACSCVAWVLFTLPVIWELTTILNIRCFVVKPYDPNVPLPGEAAKPKAH